MCVTMCVCITGTLFGLLHESLAHDCFLKRYHKSVLWPSAMARNEISLSSGKCFVVRPTSRPLGVDGGSPAACRHEKGWDPGMRSASNERKVYIHIGLFRRIQPKVKVMSAQRLPRWSPWAPPTPRHRRYAGGPRGLTGMRYINIINSYVRPRAPGRPSLRAAVIATQSRPARSLLYTTASASRPAVPWLMHHCLRLMPAASGFGIMQKVLPKG